MRTVLGPFHPHLEDALCAEVVRQKQQDPFAPLLILVPSAALRRRLKILFARERRLSLINFHVLTFHQLSLELYEERHGCRPERLADDLYLEEILRQILRTNSPAVGPFAGLEEKIGGCAALWQTLRDLRDGMVDPAQTLEAAREGYFGSEDGDRISRLAIFYQDFLSHCAAARIQDYSDLDVWAAGQAASSTFLKQFEAIYYYGFYDLTQVQLDVFQAVARHFPTTLYFPLVLNHPAWEFAQSFYERYLHGLAETREIRNLLADPEAGQNGNRRYPLALFLGQSSKIQPLPARDLSCTIISCSSPQDELAVTAKEILRLVTRQGIPFSEIAVVARSLDAYQPSMREVFSQHCIPISTSATEPLRQFPLVKAVLLLLRLAARDYPRSDVVDLLASPSFNLDLFSSGSAVPRPDLWDVLTRRLGITKGFDEWRRLERFLEKEIRLAEGSGEAEESRTLSIPATQIGILWRVFCALYRDLGLLPGEHSWSGYAGAWKQLLEKHLKMHDPLTHQRDQEVQTKVLQTLEALSSLDAVAPRTSLPQFSATFERWLDAASIPMTDANIDGVAVLDAMSARGLRFRVLFLIGLNEGIFPRTIREDAFLRDRSRRVFAQVLGYKVSEKLGAFDEEKLLFALLLEAVQERLYCLHQRSDESGRAVTRSWYLDELGGALGEALAPEVAIPRSFEEKRAFEPFRQSEYLLPYELAIHLNLIGEDPLPVVEGLFSNSSRYRTGHEFMEPLEDSSAPLGAVDGVVRHLADYWTVLNTRGISPTPLEAYARCPFQFFATQVLHLERMDDPEALMGFPPSEAGKIAHAILKRFYEELLKRDFFSSRRSRLDPQTLLQALAEQVFDEYELENPVGYAVAWELVREDLTALLSFAVHQDLDQLMREGYRPMALEKEISSRLDPKWPSPLGRLPIQGKLDRIDFLAAENRYRVIDYKYKTSAAPTPADRNLLLAAVRGQRLQAPFYVLLARELLAAQGRKGTAPQIEACFYFLAPSWRNGPFTTASFPADAWDGESGKQLQESLALLLQGIDQGLFFIQPGSHCRYCTVSETCRKNHLPSRWRADGDVRTKPYRELARKKLLKGSIDEEEDTLP